MTTTVLDRILLRADHATARAKLATPGSTEYREQTIRADAFIEAARIVRQEREGGGPFWRVLKNQGKSQPATNPET